MRIKLSEIELYAYHGVFLEENVQGGWYAVEVAVDLDDKASETDNIDDTVDYSEVYRVVEKEMSVTSNLIEHVAGRIARRIKHDFPVVEHVWIKLTKKNPPIEGANINASVEINI